MSQAIIQNAVTVRQLVLGSIEAIPEEWYDHQPYGFNYTIRWNVGHMITMMNGFLSKHANFDYTLPESYSSLFVTGTKAADWTVKPPSKAELLRCLSGQCESLARVSAEAMDDKLPEPFEMGPLRFTTVGELLGFAAAHEAVHLGMISGLAKVIPVSLTR